MGREVAVHGTSHAVAQLGHVQTVGWAGLTLLSVPNWGLLRTNLASLGSLVQVGSLSGTDASVVDKRVGAVRSAVLGGLVPGSSEFADQTSFVGGIPGGVARDT